MSRRRTALGAALSLLPLGQPLLLGTVGITTATTAVFLQAPPAVAQDSSAVARIAKAITVRIEGATQGSGVLVKQEGNRYTVLTAWHVVSGNRPGEELAIFTPDEREHQLEQGSIKRLGKVDMAVLTFSSSGSYEVASIGDVKSVSMGNQIFVAGFPLPTSAVPLKFMRLLDGKVIAKTDIALPDGYQLLYSNPTLEGMSGGAVINTQGELVGIHGRAEKDDQTSTTTGKAIATRTNMAVPITYYINVDRPTPLASIERIAKPETKPAAYPQVEMDACLKKALPNVIKKGLDATPNDVEKYCDCALRKIIVEGKEFKESVTLCNAKFIFKSI